MHGCQGVLRSGAAWACLLGAARQAWSKTSPAGIFVWTIWAALLLLALGYVWHYGRNCPYLDEWDTVPALVGEYPLFTWLWSQENEHRAPLPKFVYYALTRLSGYDFRATMYASVVAQAVLAAALTLAIRRLRGQHHYADAFFAVLLLHWGHYQVFLWGYCFPFPLTAALTGAGIMLILANRTTLTLGFALTAGIVILLLALSAAHGLLLALGLSVWAGFLCVRQWRQAPLAQKGLRLLLLAFVGVVLLWAAYYLATYVRPGLPTDYRPGAVGRTALQFLSIGMGPAGSHVWRIKAYLAAAVVVVSMLLLLRVALANPLERGRAVGLLCVLGAVAAVSLAVGIGRAGLGLGGGLTTRYIVLAALACCCLFFGWHLYGGRVLGRLLPMSLLAASVALLALNMEIAKNYGSQQNATCSAFEGDLQAGHPPAVLGSRHVEKIHPNEQSISRGVMLLDRAGARHFKMALPATEAVRP